MNAWPLIASSIYHGLRIGTLSSVRAIDEGGLAMLASLAPVVVAANHQSHADTAVLFSLLPRPCRARVRFVASSVRFARARPGAPIGERVERWLLHGLAVHAYQAILVGGDANGLRRHRDVSGGHAIARRLARIHQAGRGDARDRYRLRGGTRAHRRNARGAAEIAAFPAAPQPGARALPRAAHGEGR